MVRGKRLLDGPAVGAGAAKRAVVVTLPAAVTPAGREHLPMDETLNAAVSRRAPLTVRSTSPAARREGWSHTGAQTFMAP